MYRRCPSQPRRKKTVSAKKPAPCSTSRRRRRAGSPPTRTRSRCAAGAGAPRSPPSRRSSPSTDLRHVPRAFRQRRLLRGGDPQPRWLRQFLRLHRSSRQRARHLQAHRGRARGPAPARRQGVPRGRRRGQSARRGLPRSSRTPPRRPCSGPPPTAAACGAATPLARAVPRSPTARSTREPGQDRRAGFRLAVAPGDDPSPHSVSRHFGPWLERQRRERSREEARAAFLAEVEDGSGELRPACAIRCCRISAKACCISPSASARCSPTRWASARRCRRSPPASCWPAARASRACWWSARPRSRPSGRSRSPASPSARRASVFGAAAAAPRRLPRAARSSPSSTTSRCWPTPTTSTRCCAPDVVVLDEAQRIKNWQTKTARRVKSLRSPYAFVLTGTPIENRIDELYSIVQYLDPELVGPLFRFNRDFYAARRARPAGRLPESRRAAPARWRR